MYLCLCFKTMMKMLWSSCVRLQIPLAKQHSSVYLAWNDFKELTDIFVSTFAPSSLFLSMSPYHRNVCKTEHDVVSEQFVQFVNNIWQFSSPPASPLTDPPPSLCVNAGCRWLESWVNYICAPSVSVSVLYAVDVFTDKTFPAPQLSLYCYSLERITK